jgi:hypothetical protein
VLGAPNLPLSFPAGLPPANLPATNVAIEGAPKFVTVPYAGEISPSDHGQYGVGLKYQLTHDTDLGLYHLRYHSTLPAPVFTYGDTPLTGPGAPVPITTGTLNIKSPIYYNVKHFDGVRMTAASMSTTLLGFNLAGELIYRDGIEALVDVNAGTLGIIPTPTRARISQADLTAIYLINPAYFWDDITLVGDVGYVHVNSVDPVSGPDPKVTSTQLTYTRDASAAAMLATMDIRNVFPAWDLQIPLSFQAVIRGHSSLLGGFGALAGNGDRRASIGATFTYLQRLALSLSYNAYFGTPDYTERPQADRDNVSFSAKYGF